MTAENLARPSLLKLEDSDLFYIDANGNFTNREGKILEWHTYASLARKVLEAWMNSEGHRKNMMGDYSNLGCGVSSVVFSNDNAPYIYITQNFGTSL